ncbi:ABC transporter permease/substrate-binding protein [Blastopirellula sp. JC732]|uniref:ABC transporter permease/substrate-binding protein n=1 Tax=Blastopirellula sediminis TaxID=2894196 RepID=A0A9X1SFH7_9BACT|nr:ABC transporter permease/substrate-binding protein [Blastopirellula sediminis]MCC9608905.1 ABC transporter permease/substrate-binding protein [Blastopirellula sediminis]MCC9628318.1 ABC transporter permease/substrate-binding protein [Blastopirellula sediminis]
MSEVLEQLQFLPDRLAGHVFLSFTALLIGGLISVPLGIWCSRRKQVERISLTTASLIQTIPSLALLAAMVFASGEIGWGPALVALVLYSLLPMLRNTITGIQSVDPACLEAAEGLGMDSYQRLRMVELPLAAPTIVAGVRTAAVWVVGAATIAFPVGATSLGDYIFAGLFTNNPYALGVGCFFCAALALGLDALLGTLESGVRTRNRAARIGSVIGIAALAISPLLVSFLPLGGGSYEEAGPRPVANATEFDDRKYVIGCKGFTEQLILAQALSDELAEAGRQVERKEGIGSAMIFEALKNGKIDCYVDYTGTLWANVLEREDQVSSPEMLIDLATELKGKHQVISLGPLGFRNDYVFVMKREKAEELGIKTLDDLAKHASELRAVSEAEFWERPEWAAVRSAYQFDFDQKRAMDAGLMYGAVANDKADVVVAFRTDGRIVANDLVEIADPARALPPYQAVLLASKRLAEDPDAVEQLRRFVNSISTAEMRNANRSVDSDGASISAAADKIKPEE